MQHQSPSSVLLNLVHPLPFPQFSSQSFCLSLPVHPCVIVLFQPYWGWNDWRERKKQIENSTNDCSKKKKISLVIAKLKYSLKAWLWTRRLPSWKDTLAHWLLLRFGQRTGQEFSLNMNRQNSHIDDLLIKVKTCVDTAKGLRKKETLHNVPINMQTGCIVTAFNLSRIISSI